MSQSIESVLESVSGSCLNPFTGFSVAPGVGVVLEARNGVLTLWDVFRDNLPHPMEEIQKRIVAFYSTFEMFSDI